MEIELIEIDGRIAVCPECQGSLWWDGPQHSIVCVNSNDTFHKHRHVTDGEIVERVRKWLRGQF